MARIILSSYMFRYPLGGMLSWALQYILGLKDLGHDVYVFEKYGYPNSCFDPSKGLMSNDCTYGLKVVSDLLSRFGLDKKWCYVGYGEQFNGLSRKEVNEIFRTADLFIDSGAHGSWEEESSFSPLRVLIDGEPGYTQFKWANNVAQGLSFNVYDFYFTNGKNIGLYDNKIPTLGINWRHIYSPVKTKLFTFNHKKKDGYYSTIMNWKSHSSIQFNGQIYGQKDEEFLKFITLPKLVSAPLEIAVSGKDVPIELLKLHNWSIKNAKLLTLSFDSFCQYLYTCKGEFSICKNVFISGSTGWFSDKSAAFLASGKPVVLQDTGFSKHLPTGDGLFAVNDVQEAREAIHKIESNYSYHCRKAREIACEYLEAKNVMNKFLDEVGI